MQGFALQDIVILYQPEPHRLKNASFIAGLDKPVNALFVLSSPLLPEQFLSIVSLCFIAELFKVIGIRKGGLMRVHTHI